MATRKATLTAEEKLAFAARVKAALDTGATLWVSVPTTSRSNLSYSLRLRLIGGSTNADMWLNYWFAAEDGASLNAADDVRQQGLGTDRAFQAACDIAYFLRRHGLAEARFEYEIKARWF